MASQGRLAQIYNHMKRTYAKQQAYIDMGMGATLNSIMMTMMKLLVTTHGVPTVSSSQMLGRHWRRALTLMASLYPMNADICGIHSDGIHYYRHRSNVINNPQR